MALRPFPKAAALIVAVVLALARVASAHQGDGGNSVSLLRDTEIEADIRTMMTPIWQVAGLDPDAVHVYLVDDDSINSFVAGGQNIFINSGLVLRAKSPNQLIGVLAHETGHIAGGHLYKSAEAMHDASIEEIIALAAGAAATVASR
ncbi:MAG: M48 family metalloprotease, partial [Stellaceae bacterium]